MSTLRRPESSLFFYEKANMLHWQIRNDGSVILFGFLYSVSEVDSIGYI